MNAPVIYKQSRQATVRDTDLGERLGMSRPADIRRTIEANRQELEGYGHLHVERANSGRTGSRLSTAYNLNEAQALLLCAFSRAPKAAEVRRELIMGFMAQRRQANAAPIGVENRAVAAHGWADQYEAMRPALTSDRAPVNQPQQ